jgi:glucose-1-phosphate thymidylyltransferase
MDNNIRTKNEYQLTDALMKMVSDGVKMVPFEIQNWFDCGKPETLLSTNTYILNRDHISEDEREFKNTKLRQPVYIGKNCTIENSEIGPDVTIAEGAVVKNCKISSSLICENSYAENARLENVVIGSGEKATRSLSNTMIGDNMLVGF